MPMSPLFFRSMICSVAVILATIAVITPAPVFAQSLNWQLHHQGRLLDEAGAPLEGRHRLTFTLFRDELELWRE